MTSSTKSVFTCPYTNHPKNHNIILKPDIPRNSRRKRHAKASQSNCYKALKAFLQHSTCATSRHHRRLNVRVLPTQQDQWRIATSPNVTEEHTKIARAGSRGSELLAPSEKCVGDEHGKWSRESRGRTASFYVRNAIVVMA